MPRPAVTPSSTWEVALHELGLDHPALMRLSSTRDLLEQCHRIHEARRTIEERILDAEAQVEALRREHEATTADGLALLDAIQAEVASYTADLSGISDRLRSRFDGAELPAEHDAEITADAFAVRFNLEDQYESIIDMFAAFGIADPRTRALEFHNGNGRTSHLPSFEAMVEGALTKEVRTHLARARRVQLLITPAADHRVFAAIGKTVAFNNYAGSTAGSSGPKACADFVKRLRANLTGDLVSEDLLKRSPFEGVRFSFYAEMGGDQTDLRAQGQNLETTFEDIAMRISEASYLGVDARPMTPPEYLMLQAMRRRTGIPLLDNEDGSGGRQETWFPEQRLAGAPGTLVARSVVSGLRFRSVEISRGSEGRGYRIAYAPLMAAV